MLDHVWYAAYGSNLNRERFAKYVDIEPSEPSYPEDHWMVSTGTVSMAGESKRWGGGVAFFDPSKGTAMMRRYRLTIEQFLSLWSGENRGADLGDQTEIVDRLSRATLENPDICIDVDGLYDRAWMLDEVDGVPVLTITTSRDIPAAPAGERYLLVIRLGLAEAPATPNFCDRYVAAIQARSAIGDA